MSKLLTSAASVDCDRTQFLRGIAGIGGMSIIAGCGGSATLTSPQANRHTLQSLMLLTGVSSIVYQGMHYDEDGTIRPVHSGANALDCTINQYSNARSTQTVCVNDGTAPPVLQTIGFVTVNMGPPPAVQVQSSGYGTDFGGYIGFVTGPTYNPTPASRKPWAACTGEIAVAGASALNVARSITANSGQYAAAVGQSAQQVLGRWGNAGNVMPVAMGLEFLGLVLAALGPGEVLGLLATAGLTIGAFILMAKCLNQGT